MDINNNVYLERYSPETLKYYMFDWDDNILSMSSKIHLEHRVDGVWTKEDISTSDFAEIRLEIAKYYEKGGKADWKFINDDKETAFCEFRDKGPRGKHAFPDDVKDTINICSFGPVWNEFIKCLIGGHRFLIVTARGHEPGVIKEAVKWIINNVLTPAQKSELIHNLIEWNRVFCFDDTGFSDDKQIEHYLELCSFIGISSEWFSLKFNVGGEFRKPEQYKPMAVRYFIERLSTVGENLYSRIKVGFSDDDLLTAETIENYFKEELSNDFPFEYFTYHTKEDGTVNMLG